MSLVSCLKFGDKSTIRKPDEEVLNKVRAAFQACVELIRFYRRNRDVLNTAAENSRPEFQPLMTRLSSG